jgi:ATP-dependent protease ClpP protease subunit
MAKELYLYSPIYDFVAQDLIASMEENKGSDIVIRSNTPGGSVFAGWGIIAKMGEHDGKVTVKVDGMAASMGFYMLLFADYVEALDVSKFMVHRADGYVSTPEDQLFLDNINKDLKAKFSSKIDNEKLKNLKSNTNKYGVEDIFNPEKRIEINLSAKDAKEIGLISKITKVTPTEIQALNERLYAIAASHQPEENKKITQMDINKLKAEHPAIYAEAIALGIAQEKDRVGAAMVWFEVDPAGVKAAIESGSQITAKQTQEFQFKAMSAAQLAAVKKDNPADVKTKEAEGNPTATAEELADEAVLSEFRKRNNIK